MTSLLKNLKESTENCEWLESAEIKSSDFQKQIYDFSVLENLTEHKKNQQIIISFYSHFDLAKSERAESCSRVVVFARLIDITNGQQKLEISQIHTCQLRFCSCCAWRRQLKFAKLTHDTLKAAMEKQMKLRFIFLTLTVKNPRLEDLNQTIKQMQKAFSRMSNTVKWKKSILGYCRVFEITKPKCASEQGNIHPHFHVLLAVKTTYFKSKDQYLKKDDYAEMWQKALGVDYTPVCDVRIIKPRKKNGEVIKDTTAAISELVKYPMKDTDLKRFTPQEFQILDEQMTRVRAINYGGILKKANKQNIDDVEIDMESLEFLREIELIVMKYNKDQKRYIPLESNKRGVLNQ